MFIFSLCIWANAWGIAAAHFTKGKLKEKNVLWQYPCYMRFFFGRFNDYNFIDNNSLPPKPSSTIF
jgi:hypothetical protein